MLPIFSKHERKNFFQMSNKKILVFGSSSFLAQKFIDIVTKSRTDMDIYRADRQSESDTHSNPNHYYYEGASEIGCIIRKIKPAYVINFVGIFGSSSYEEMMYVNAIIPETIMDALISVGPGIEKAVFIGSAAEYGIQESLPITEMAELKPVGMYGLTKSIQTSVFNYYTRMSNAPFCLARVFNAIGEGMHENLAIPSFVRQVTSSPENGVLEVGNLENYRDYVDASDIGVALLDLLDYGVPGEIYNICSGLQTKMEDVVKMLIEISGKQMKVDQKKNLRKTNDVPYSQGSFEKISRLSGWKPKNDLRSSLKKIVSKSQV